MIEIPADRLSEGVLHALVREFVLREGTDYGYREVELETKVAQVQAQIKNGQVIITFDEREQTCNLIDRTRFKQLFGAGGTRDVSDD